MVSVAAKNRVSPRHSLPGPNPRCGKTMGEWVPGINPGMTPSVWQGAELKKPAPLRNLPYCLWASKEIVIGSSSPTIWSHLSMPKSERLIVVVALKPITSIFSSVIG